MKYNIMTFSSINPPSRLKRAASKKGMFVNIIRTPTSLSDKGCSYSIRYKEIDNDGLISLADNLKLNYRRIFKEQDKNNNEYIKLYDKLSDR